MPMHATINHFWAMTLFALAVSVAFAYLTKNTAAERFKYFLWAFLTFLIVGIGIGWLMYPFSH
jgi:cytochrome bd-type quinol oxidase subunit 2